MRFILSVKIGIIPKINISWKDNNVNAFFVNKVLEDQLVTENGVNRNTNLNEQHVAII